MYELFVRCHVEMMAETRPTPLICTTIPGRLVWIGTRSRTSSPGRRPPPTSSIGKHGPPMFIVFFFVSVAAVVAAAGSGVVAVPDVFYLV